MFNLNTTCVYQTAEISTVVSSRYFNLITTCVYEKHLQDYITERLKKIGGNTSFNVFISKELDMMSKLINEIKTTLQVG